MIIMHPPFFPTLSFNTSPMVIIIPPIFFPNDPWPSQEPT